ncbi:MAG: HAMP domain-containing histidine kinase, partial [Propionibacteriaceae bacterium]|nr:HAMP domain-containing histidine kinase [Propionibacteriaceae bacterium]
AIQVPADPGEIIGPGDIVIRPRTTWGWLNAYEVIWTVAIIALLSLVLTPLAAWLMARRAVHPLAEALRLQRHFIADASHELRTPLTALSSRVQILQRRLDSGKPVDDVVSQLRDDTANMAGVLDDMLLIVEGEPSPHGWDTSLAGCLRHSVTSLDSLAEQANVGVRLRVMSDMSVAVPEVSLTRAVVAIVDNAIQHSPEDTTVEVHAEAIDNNAVIRVTDHGSGIEGVNPDRIFERFSHGKETGRKRSFGLGLALASEVAHRFNGDIRVESTSSKGTTFALTVPLAH